MKYNIILADPCWAFQQFSSSKNGAAISHYNTMSHEDIADLPVEQMAEQNSVLFLWSPFAKLEEALYVMKKWGFKYKTTGFVWNKTFKNGNAYKGLGFYTRAGAEVCLLGTRGKPLPRKSHNVNQVITAPIGKHSAKPAIVRDKIIELFGDLPRIELFARPPLISGWDMLGYEIDGKDIRDTLKEKINV